MYTACQTLLMLSKMSFKSMEVNDKNNSLPKLYLSKIHLLALKTKYQIERFLLEYFMRTVSRSWFRKESLEVSFGF